MFDTLQTLASNDLFAGGVGVAAMGGLLASLHRVPGEVFRRVRSHCLVSLDVLGDEPPFKWVQGWLAQHEYAQRSRYLTLTASTGNETAVFTPAPGAHFLRYEGRLMWITRTREEAQSMSVLWRESMTIRFLSRDPQIARRFVEEAKRAYEKPVDGKIGLRRPQWDTWADCDRIVPRSLDSVVLEKPSTLADLVEDVKRFREREPWYRNAGIPYRRGYLFHGTPGSGKSSAIMALAGALGADIYMLALSLNGMNDARLMELLMEVPTGAFVVLEDVDAAFVQRDSKDATASSLTFSGLLNAIDGIGAREGRVLFMTTNHKELLDPALIRAGRVDRCVEFGPATKDQAERLYRRFYPEATLAAAHAFAQTVKPGENMADIQGRLIASLHDHDQRELHQRKAEAA